MPAMVRNDTKPTLRRKVTSRSRLQLGQTLGHLADDAAADFVDRIKLLELRQNFVGLDDVATAKIDEAAAFKL
ncbi:hypothetical protein C5Y93_19965 [Blastopirellula marina]|uniref:Uncharacterized protein n=1 Tax=Blastopirellula marina TaxID=124 RepID=A0A2S8GIU1_9BACT|nr:hypothetical protein C5Y93_19965 [Blastopirellula marina]